MFQAGFNGTSLISLSQTVFMQTGFEMWLSELDIRSNVKQFIMQKYPTSQKITSLLRKTPDLQLPPFSKF